MAWGARPRSPPTPRNAGARAGGNAALPRRAAPEDPLLLRWQYGLGRAAVFTSDAKNRWAASWVAWPGFDKLWANIFRDLLPHAESSEVGAEFDRAANELVVDYHLGRNVPCGPPITTH